MAGALDAASDHAGVAPLFALGLALEGSNPPQMHAVLWKDGSVISQMGKPSMKIPIQYAMTYPDRLDGTVDTYSPEIFNNLNFYTPDLDKFTSLTLGFMAAEKGGTYGSVMNAANEEAVAAFMDGRIGFHEIFDRVAQVMERHTPVAEPSLEEILEADAWAREETARC